MEIVHIVRQYRPSIGGLEDAVSNLCAHLSRTKDVTVRIVTLDRWFANPDRRLPHRETIDGIEVTRILYKGSSRYPIAPSVLREIASADIVHVHAIDFFFDFLALTAWMHRKPLVASTHGGFFHTKFASRLKMIYFQTVTRLSSCAYFALCSSSENDTATFCKIAPNKVVTIENGVNIEKWANCAAPELCPSMIFIGRWVGNKRLPLLIKLLAALKEKNAVWKLTIAGLPGDETESSLAEASHQAGVFDQVKLVASPQEADIAKLISEASYIVSASEYEGFGISLIEGLSAGLFPITSLIPTFEKVQNALGFGVVIDPDDLCRTAENILKFHVKATEQAKSLREKCVACAQHYDWGRVAESFYDIYRNALKGRPFCQK